MAKCTFWNKTQSWVQVKPEQNTLLRLNFAIVWDNCLLCSRPTTGLEHHPKSRILKSPVWPSSRTSRPWLSELFGKVQCALIEEKPFPHTWQHINPRGEALCTPRPGNGWRGAAEHICPARQGQPGQLMASLWQRQLGSSTEHEETSVGIFARLHARQGTCVHLKIHFCFQTLVLGSC